MAINLRNKKVTPKTMAKAIIQDNLQRLADWSEMADYVGFDYRDLSDREINSIQDQLDRFELRILKIMNPEKS